MVNRAGNGDDVLRKKVHPSLLDDGLLRPNDEKVKAAPVIRFPRPLVRFGHTIEDTVENFISLTSPFLGNPGRLGMALPMLEVVTNIRSSGGRGSGVVAGPSAS